MLSNIFPRSKVSHAHLKALIIISHSAYSGGQEDKAHFSLFSLPFSIAVLSKVLLLLASLQENNSQPFVSENGLDQVL